MKNILKTIGWTIRHPLNALCWFRHGKPYSSVYPALIIAALLALPLALNAASTVTLSTNVVTETVSRPVVTKTTVETVDPNAVNVTPAAATVTTTTTTTGLGSLSSGLETLLGIHDTNKPYFMKLNNSIQLDQSAVTDTRKSGVYQATQLGVWHRIDPSWEIGLVGEADSLAAAGTTIDAIGGHVMARYDWDNVALRAGFGGIRDVAAKTGLLEFLVGFEWRISPNVGTILATGFGYDTGTANKDKIVDRLFVGATIALGK